LQLNRTGGGLAEAWRWMVADPISAVVKAGQAGNIGSCYANSLSICRYINHQEIRSLADFIRGMFERSGIIVEHKAALSQHAPQVFP